MIYTEPMLVKISLLSKAIGAWQIFKLLASFLSMPQENLLLYNHLNNLFSF